ncbi:MAG: metallophosphoesterase family protein [Chloroflexi bacterium]|nr:metallophosphoesterase family protein [Chloroflexota bacterium]
MTDVHGNAAALRAVLDDIDATSAEVERIYCLGDMIAIGPDTNEVLDLLVARSDLSMLRGNHEDAVLRAIDGQDPGTPGTERLHHLWVARQLRPDHAQILRHIPRALEPEYDGQRLLLVHYHLDSRGDFLPVDKEPTVQSLDALYRHSAARAVCFGHHHPRHFFRSVHRVYVNPGALGCYHLPVARYAVLTCSRRGIAVEMKGVPYDNRDFLASYDRLAVPAGDFIVRTFHGGQKA